MGTKAKKQQLIHTEKLLKQAKFQQLLLNNKQKINF